VQCLSQSLNLQKCVSVFFYFYWLLPRQWGLGLNFGSVFFSPPRSVTNRHLVSKACASPVHAKSTWNLQKLSLWKVSTDSMISTVMKSYTNKHMVRGRPTLKDIKQLQKPHRMIVNQVESQHKLKNVWTTRAERLENLFTNVSVLVHLSITLWETSLSIKKIKSWTKWYFLVIFLLQSYVSLQEWNPCSELLYI